MCEILARLKVRINVEKVGGVADLKLGVDFHSSSRSTF